MSIVPTTPEHIAWMQENCREKDRAEFWESSFQTPTTAAEYSMRHGETFTGLHEGVPVAIFGIVPQSVIMKGAYIWLVSSPQIEKCPTKFLREGRRWLLEKSQKYGMLLNYVDARYVESVRWVRWLGFEIHDPAPYGQNKMPFHKITFKGGIYGSSRSAGNGGEHSHRGSQSE